MTEEMGVFDAIHHTRAMRRLKPDPVPEELLIKLIDAANQAPSGSNQQNARWIVVRDSAQRAKLAELNNAAVEAYIGPGSGRPAALPHQDADRRARLLKAVVWQAEHMHEIPVLIIACLEFASPPRSPGAGGGNIWPGVQNLLLAARALGLGVAPTTLGLSNGPAAKEVLRLPENVVPVCLIPVGYPKGRFGPVTRKPVAEIMRWDTWS